MQVEHAFNTMASEQGIMAAFLHFAANDAVLLRNNKLIKGKNEFRSYFNSNVARPDESLMWNPEFVEVSDAGDLAYTYGPFTYSYTDKNGETITNKGVFHSVWKRQNSGEWKFVWD
jgi:ketosteroid isomerase-like protein